MIGQTNAVNSGFAKYLGTGTNFDVSDIPGYKNFTVDNFIVAVKSATYKGSANGDGSAGASGSLSVKKSYDSSTGTLKITGSSGSASGNSEYMTASASCSLSLEVYCLINVKIK